MTPSSEVSPPDPTNDTVIDLRLWTYNVTDHTIPESVAAFGVRQRSLLLNNNGFDDKLEVYVNYAHGDEGDVPWYGSRNLGKLSALKAKYDPGHVFSYSEPVN